MSAGPRPNAALRLCAFYVASFAALAVWISYWPLWLLGQGCTDVEVGLLATALIVARTVAGPLWAQRADRGGGPRPTLILLSALSLVAFAPFGLGGGAGVFLVWTVLFGLCYPPIHPLIDSLTLTVGRERGVPYGRVRLWGSLSFLVVTVAAGALLEARGAGIVYFLVLAALVLTAVASTRLPRAEAGPAKATGRPLRELLASRPFLLALLAVGLIMSSHAAFYTYGAIHWQRAGLGEGTIGWLLAEGVLAEIVLFRVAARFTARVSAGSLIAAGALGAFVRWLVLGAATAPWAIAAVQWLHALSFGCTHLGALLWIGAHVPRDRQTTAQGLMAAFAAGACNAVTTGMASAWYPAGGGTVFYGMAAAAAVGGGLALRLRR